MTESTPPPVLLDVADGVATVRLNRPDAMNSLDVTTKELLRDTLQQRVRERLQELVSPPPKVA